MDLMSLDTFIISSNSTSNVKQESDGVSSNFICSFNKIYHLQKNKKKTLNIK